jgi:hypothetical protein
MTPPEESLRSCIENDPRWKLLERILAAPGFAKSARLSSLLLYIVKQSLLGKDGELHEQHIGERVFGRLIGYDPRDDNIVRSHVSRLRQRLEQYFREGGKQEPLRITIPRGSYVPLFERVDTPASMEAQAPLVPEEAQQQPVHAASEKSSSALRPIRWIYLGGGIGGILGMLLLLLSAWILASAGWGGIPGRKETPTYRLWSAMFSSGRDTLIVPADSGLIILKSFTKHPVSVADYANGKYLSEGDCAQPCDQHLLETLAGHRYTSLADLKFAVALTRLPEALPSRTEIRFARDLQLDDLKQTNLILIGSVEADPWLELFQHQMNFVLHDDKLAGPLEIENRDPMPRERASYLYDGQDPRHRGFALVAFLPNLSGTGNVLVVQGFTLAGTQAAAEFVTDHEDFDSLFRSIIARRHGLPHFEVLLRTMDVNGIGSRPSIVAYRVY